jgi:hypothetical protein
MRTKTLASLSLPLVLGAVVGALGITSCNEKSHDVVAPEAASSGDLERRIRELEAERDADKHAAQAAGLENQTQAQTIAQLAQRLKALEEKNAALVAATGSTGSAPATSATPSAPVALLAPPASDGSFSDDQLATFRKLWDAADKQKNMEQQADRVKKRLAAAGVSLTPQQEEAVVKLQANYQERMREIFREGFAAGGDQTGQRAKLDELRGQFETDLRSVVPAGDADKIVATMKQSFPQFFPGGRSERPTGRGGMGGGNTNGG